MVVLTSFTQPTDGVRHRQQNTVVYVNDNNLGKGTLYIAESRLSWIGETGDGFSIEYPHISLHAISRDLSAFPQECLFLMLDTSLGDEDQSNGQEEDDDYNESSRQETTEMRLVPDDRGMLDAMFHAMNACQALHPDPEDSFSDEDFFEDADEIPMEEADSQMARLRIGNMDGRAHIGGRVEDMVEDRIVGRLGGIIENRAFRTGAAGRVAGTLEDMGEGTLEGIVGGKVGGTVEGMVAGTVEGIVGGKVGGTVADTAVGTVEGTVADMVGGTVGGTVEGTVADTVEGILADTVGGTLVDMAAGTVEGTVVDMMADVEGMGEGISVYTRIHTARGDRSIFLGNNSHRDRTADFPVQHSTHMVLDSNFDDAEN